MTTILSWFFGLLIIIVFLLIFDGFADLLAPPLNWLAQKLGLQEPPRPPGAELIGKRGTVAQDSSYGAGARVEHQGTTWGAHDAAGKALSVGQEVRVVKVNGLTLVVEILSSDNS